MTLFSRPEAVTVSGEVCILRFSEEKNIIFKLADIFVYKNAIKPNYSPKWGIFGRVGNFVGIFANFSGNSGENFLATLIGGSELYCEFSKLHQLTDPYILQKIG